MDIETLAAAAELRMRGAHERSGNYSRPGQRRCTEQRSASSFNVMTSRATMLIGEPGTRSSSAPLAGGTGDLEFNGFASVTEVNYNMWDIFGPYEEVIDASAFDSTLSSGPDVAFLLNHKGMTLARTTSGTLTIGMEQHPEFETPALASRAMLDPANTEVNNIRSGMNRQDLTEMSFAFMINRGEWSPDYLQYRIKEVDIDRGDVSVVNYGANPFTDGASLRADDGGTVARSNADALLRVRAQAAILARPPVRL